MAQRIYVIGGQGLVGSAVCRWLTRHNTSFELIQRANAASYAGSRCDLLINCNGNAHKGKAMADPLFDFDASVRSVAAYTHDIKAGLTVMMSTVDVYPVPSDAALTREASIIDRTQQNAYGFHKLMAEDIVRCFAGDHLIFRLPGLAGSGLKKNPLFDFLDPGKSMLISAKSRLNFIHTDVVADILFKMIDRNVRNETFNIAARNSLCLSDLPSLTGLSSPWADGADSVLQVYDINTDKAQAYVDLPTSEDAVRGYMRDLKVAV